MVALILSKVIAVYTPLIYRDAVNALSNQGVDELFLGAIGLTVAYGVSRIFTNGFQQLRDVLFAKVAQELYVKLHLKLFDTYTHYLYDITSRVKLVGFLEL